MKQNDYIWLLQNKLGELKTSRKKGAKLQYEHIL